MKISEDKIINEFKQMPWEVWLHRRFCPFVVSIMMWQGTREGFKSIGLDGQYPIALYDTEDWYSTEEMFRLGEEEAKKFLQQKNIFLLTRDCEEYLENGRIEINKILDNPSSDKEDFAKVVGLIQPINVWIAHAIEPYFYKKLKEILQPYVNKNNLEKFIGDISYPSKKNALARMEADIYGGVPKEELHQKYAWIKARGGFKPGYTLSEMEEIIQKTLNKKINEVVRPEVPKEVFDFVKETQELVYLRTLRTDAQYELYYMAQPILKRFASSIGIESVENCVADELLKGRVQELPHNYAILKNYDDIVVTESIINSEEIIEREFVRGVIAQLGKATGEVKIIYTPKDVHKIKEGDVLVTNMTIPAYISAMYKAAAFVTDEGGITCHAAIVARELKKPCITGTKIATKVFKDGDMVEVDANNGVVRKI